MYKVHIERGNRRALLPSFVPQSSTSLMTFPKGFPSRPNLVVEGHHLAARVPEYLRHVVWTLHPEKWVRPQVFVSSGPSTLCPWGRPGTSGTCCTSQTQQDPGRAVMDRVGEYGLSREIGKFLEAMDSWQGLQRMTQLKQSLNLLIFLFYLSLDGSSNVFSLKIKDKTSDYSETEEKNYLFCFPC